MAELPHLKLQRAEVESPRKKKRGGGTGARRRFDQQRKDMENKLLSEREKILSDFAQWKSKYGDTIEPALIFKINTNASIQKKDLERMGLKVLCIEGKKATIVFSSDEHLFTFRQKIQQYSEAKQEYIFDLNIDYIQYLMDKEIHEELIAAFKNNGKKLSPKAKIEQVDEAIWEVIDGFNYYRIESTGNILKIFRKKYSFAFFDAFDGISDITPEEKIGNRLKENPLSDGEIGILDIDFWYSERGQILKWKHDLEQFLLQDGGRILDEYMGNSFYVVRARVPNSAFDNIISMRQISHVDLPPRMKLRMEKIRSYSVEDTEITPPDEDALGILIIDSGIMPGHPLLSKAIGEHQSFIDGKDSVDEDGHGTSVAGVAVYGNLNECIEQNRFKPEAWIYSAKVCDEEGDYDEEKLLENQLSDAVNYFFEHHPNLKIINISIGDDTHVVNENHKQFRLAALIDEIIYDYRIRKNRDIIVVISVGNSFNLLYANPDILGNYPHYLIDEDEFQAIDPGTAANALTIGSISPGLTSAYDEERRVVAGYFGFPSPFTRTGPGINGMLKPELVEISGDMIYPGASWRMTDSSIGVVVTEKDFRRKGLFTIENGTSFAAPKIANILAKVWKLLPEFSPEMIKALVINSARIPNIQTNRGVLFAHGSERPPRLESIEDAMKVYGYGIPNTEEALYSDMNRVLLIESTEIGLDNTVFYEIPVPDEFYDERGEREISITLSFVPTTRRTRGDSYLGCIMEFHLFKGISFEDLKSKYSVKKATSVEELLQRESVPQDLRKYEIKMEPGNSIRIKSTIQKATRKIQRVTFRDDTLKLVVICRDRWINEEDYRQKYAIIATISHSQEINLYNRIQQRIHLRERERVRIEV